MSVTKGFRLSMDRSDLLIVDCWASQHRMYISYDEVEGLVAKNVVKRVGASD